jgi:carbamoyltransferase
MHVLGISCVFHDVSALLFRDGNVIATAREWPFAVKKHSYNSPLQPIH